LQPDAFSPQPSFLAPASVAGTTVEFVLTVGDGVDTSPSSEPVSIDVSPHIYWVGLSGAWVPVLIEVAGPPLLLDDTTLLGDLLLGP
jgi:hypothetical protein